MTENTIENYLKHNFTFEKTTMQIEMENMSDDELINVIKDQNNTVTQCMKAKWCHAYFLLCDRHNITKFMLTKEGIYQSTMNTILKSFKTVNLIVNGNKVIESRRIKFHGKLILSASSLRAFAGKDNDASNSKFTTSFSNGFQNTEETKYNFYIIYEIIENISKYLLLLSEDQTMSSILSDVLPYSCGMGKASSTKHKDKAKRNIPYKNPIFNPAFNVDKPRGIGKNGKPYDFNTRVLNGNDFYIEGTKKIHKPISYYNPNTHVVDLSVLTNAFTPRSECLLQLDWENVSSNKYIVCKPSITFILVMTNKSSQFSGDPFAEDATESEIMSLHKPNIPSRLVEVSDDKSEASFGSDADLLLSN
jgi:hypothetical protein